MNGKSLGAAAASENKRSRHICSRIKRLKNVMSTCNFAHQTTHQSQSTSDFLSKKKKKKKTKERNVWLVAQLLLFHNMHVVVVAKVCAPLCAVGLIERYAKEGEREALFYFSFSCLMMLICAFTSSSSPTRMISISYIHTHYRLCLSLFLG